MASKPVIIDYARPTPRKGSASWRFSPVVAVVWSLLSTPITTFVPALWTADAFDDITPRLAAVAIVSFFVVGLPAGCVLYSLLGLRRSSEDDEDVPKGFVLAFMFGCVATFMGGLTLFYVIRA